MGSTPSTVFQEVPLVNADHVGDYPEDEQKYWTVDATAEQNIIIGKGGPASAIEDDLGWVPTTVHKMFQMALKDSADKNAMAVEVGLATPTSPKDVPTAVPRDEWSTWTYQEYYDEACAAAKAFIKLGVEAHDAVNIYGFNSPEWVLAEYAAIFCGAMAAGIYPSDTVDQVKFKCKHSGASLAACEDKKKFEAFAQNLEDTPKLKAIVCWSFTPESKELTRADGSVVQCLTWEQLLEMGRAEDNTQLDQRMAAQKPGHCCALIYTSGTTGNPKAVMISHDNILFESWTVLQHIPKFCVDAKRQERIISYLPLSHVAGMMVDIICPVLGTALKPSYTTVYFARPYDLKLMSLKDRICTVRPTIFIGVPRVWEKFAEKLKAVGAVTKGLKKKISTFAKAKNLKHQKRCQLGGSGKKPSNFNLANKIVNKIKGAIGLDQCHFGFTGAAPITVETLSYFGSLGIQINEVYGMSECTGATTWSTDECHVWGSCGYIIPGVEVKIFNEKGEECPRSKDIFAATDAEQGEICFRGRHIMMGYMANPDLGEEHVEEMKKKTQESIDNKGWLHSGDMGCLGENGMVKITGRYKELIIGAGGENIAPVPIEDKFKEICPAVSNIMMVGDKRKFNVALVTLKSEGATGELPGTDVLDGAANSVVEGVTTISAAMKNEAFIKYLQDGLVETNKFAPNSASKIQKFTVLNTDFSSETGELTPTFKLKRAVVAKQHADLIDRIYESKDVYVNFNA